MAFAVRSSKTRLPVSMFLVPKSDVFHSVVTRDSVPDPDWRSFSFHFKPGLSRGGRIERATRLLGNWFAGLAIEDCVERSRAEWLSVSAST